MPLYEYYCEPCNGIFEAIRQMRDAADPASCPECGREAPRTMSTFSAFTMREGYPRRIPDKGTYWHLGKEVKKRAKRMKGYEHPELAKPKPKARPGRGEIAARQDRALLQRSEAGYRDKWGVDRYGLRTRKTASKKPASRTLGPG
jgi:putative FmdB family regulatory protein